MNLLRVLHTELLSCFYKLNIFLRHFSYQISGPVEYICRAFGDNPGLWNFNDLIGHKIYSK